MFIHQVLKSFHLFESHKGWIFFYGYKPFIKINGCHLNGSYRVVLLATVVLNANNELFLIAYDIIEAENRK